MELKVDALVTVEEALDLLADAYEDGTPWCSNKDVVFAIFNRKPISEEEARTAIERESE